MSEFDLELQKAQEEAARSRRTAKWTMMGLALLSIFLIGAVTAALWLASTNGDLAATNAELAAENAAFGQQQQGEKKEIAKEASKALCGQGDREIYDRDLCEKWADAAQEPTIQPQEPPLATGPSQAELVNAFRIYCEEGNCKGRDGNPPTADDIAAAFMAFCADGRCVGAPGVNGTNGTDAPPPSPEMMLAAVTIYCEAGRCVGPAGEVGPGPSQESVFAAVNAYCSTGVCVGPAGPAGADSTVAGPVGATGEKGEKGDSPSSFTFTDKTGTAYTCVPNPPGSSTYTCESSGGKLP